jgi:hypothetical protein
LHDDNPLFVLPYIAVQKKGAPQHDDIISSANLFVAVAPTGGPIVFKFGEGLSHTTFARSVERAPSAASRAGGGASAVLAAAAINAEIRWTQHRPHTAATALSPQVRTSVGKWCKRRPVSLHYPASSCEKGLS